MTTRAETGGSVNFSLVQATEANRALSTLVLAFAADPHLRWLFPDAQQYLEHFPDVLQSFAGVAFAGDTVWQIEDLGALALWLPPGATPDTDATVAVFETSVPAEKLTDLLVDGRFDRAQPEPRPPVGRRWCSANV